MTQQPRLWFGDEPRRFPCGCRSTGRRAKRSEYPGDQVEEQIVGEVSLPDGKNLNQELVNARLAWWYRQFAPKDRELEQFEREAKAAGRGLWADGEVAVAPWEWRKAKGRKRR